VSADVVAYSNFLSVGSEIRFKNLITGVDTAIPNEGAADTLSDINDGRVVFSRRTSTHTAIFLKNLSTGLFSELDPHPSLIRTNAAIGSSTVVWQERANGAASGTTEIVTLDLASGATTRITSDALLDQRPAVSPDGAVLVWLKCATINSGCDVWKATKINDLWSTAAITGAEGEEGNPDTNGQLIVYSSIRPTTSGATEKHVYWRPVEGGTEGSVPSTAHQEAGPSISGTLLAFESYDSVNITVGYRSVRHRDRYPVSDYQYTRHERGIDRCLCRN